MLEISSKTNLLEQSTYKYSLQDVKEPNLYREVYPYTDVPRIPFNHRRVPLVCRRIFGLPTLPSATVNSLLNLILSSKLLICLN